MQQRSFSEWRFLMYAALAMCLAAGLIAAVGAMAQRRVLEPVRQEGPVKPRPVAGGDWEVLPPVRYENLSVFPVVARTEFDTREFLTLDEGLASGEVLVTERSSAYLRRDRDPMMYPTQQGWRVQAPQGGATVNTLVLVNRSRRPLLLLAGEVVTGGKQDRVIGKDRIVPPGADPLPLDVFCVERGRWSAGSEFKAANLMAHPSVREKAAVAKDQGQVWSAVRSGSTSEQTREYAVAERAGRARAAEAPRVSAEVMSTVIVAEAQSESYDKVYRSPTVRASVESFSAEVERRFREATRGQRVVGVVVAYSGEVAWSDTFASQALFQRYWAKLLRSYVVEALARPNFRERATIADAARFLEPLNGREQIETEPGVYRWREISEGRQAQIEIESLLDKVFTLHRVIVQKTS